MTRKQYNILTALTLPMLVLMGLVFLMILTIALVGMTLVVYARGIEESAGLMWIFVALTLAAGSILFPFLKRLK